MSQLKQTYAPFLSIYTFIIRVRGRKPHKSDNTSTHNNTTTKYKSKTESEIKHSKRMVYNLLMKTEQRSY